VTHAGEWGGGTAGGGGGGGGGGGAGGKGDGLGPGGLGGGGGGGRGGGGGLGGGGEGWQKPHLWHLHLPQLPRQGGASVRPPRVRAARRRIARGELPRFDLLDRKGFDVRRRSLRLLEAGVAEGVARRRVALGGGAEVARLALAVEAVVAALLG
jgi:hypothetical protein